MADTKQIAYSFKELAEILVKEQGIHEGFWGIYVRFGIKALNMGETEADLKPTALVPILEMGLGRMDEVNSLSVDAAVVNPAPKRRSSKGSKKKATK